MEGSTLTKPESFGKSMKNKRPKSAEENFDGNNDGDDTETEECDMEVWNTLSESFRQVQTVLDRNRSLIQQVNENHQSRVSDNMVKNVSLIREIHGNISRVISIYSGFSANFLNAIQLRQAMESKSFRDDGGGGIDKAGKANNRN